MSDAPAPAAPGLSLLETLKAIRRVLADADLTAAQRLAVIAVIAAARGTTGITRLTYRDLRDRYGFHDSTVQAVLGRRTIRAGQPIGLALGRYLDPAGRNRYRVRTDPPGDAPRHAKRDKERHAKRDKAPRSTRQRRHAQRGAGATLNEVHYRAMGRTGAGAAPEAPSPPRANNTPPADRTLTLGVARLADAFRAKQLRPQPRAEIIAQFERDVHDRAAYTHEQLRAWIDAHTAIDARAYHLKTELPGFLERRQRQQFHDRIALLSAEGRTQVSRYDVRQGTTPEGPLLRLAVDADTRKAYVLTDRGGYVAELKTLADLAHWTFSSPQGLLFDAGGRA